MSNEIKLPTSEQLDIIVAIVVMVVVQAYRTLKTNSKKVLQNAPMLVGHDLKERLDILESDLKKLTQTVNSLVENFQKSAKIGHKSSVFSQIPCDFVLKITPKSPFVTFEMSFNTKKDCNEQQTE